MRYLVLVMLVALLSMALLAGAQEEAATEQAGDSADTGNFVPSEEVAADTAVAFPTDI